MAILLLLRLKQQNICVTASHSIAIDTHSNDVIKTTPRKFVDFAVFAFQGYSMRVMQKITYRSKGLVKDPQINDQLIYNISS